MRPEGPSLGRPGRKAGIMIQKRTGAPKVRHPIIAIFGGRQGIDPGLSVAPSAL